MGGTNASDKRRYVCMYYTWLNRRRNGYGYEGGLRGTRSQMGGQGKNILVFIR
jgi:hypothetical protein